MGLKGSIIGIIIILILLGNSLAYGENVLESEAISIERGFLNLKFGMDINEFKNTIGEGYEITDKVFHVPDEKVFIVKEIPYKNKYIAEIQCFFYKDRLYRFDLAYNPDIGFWDNLVKESFNKYKKPIFENPDAYVWNDKRTEVIIFRKEYINIYRDNEITAIVEGEEDKIDPLKKYNKGFKNN